MKTSHSLRKITATAAVLVSSLALPAGAATVAEWNFNAAETGYAARAGQTATATVTRSSNQLSVSGGDHNAVSFSFNEVNLDNVGDWIEVNYQVQLSGTKWAEANTRILFAGLFDRSATDGYSGWLTTNDSNANNNLNNNQIATLSNFPSTGNTPAGTILTTNDYTIDLGSNTSTWRDASFRVARTGANSALITYQVGNNSNVLQSVSATANSGYFTFDAFDIIGGGASNLNFRLDNVSITTGIPEPGVASLLGGLGLLALLRRRR